MHMWLWGKRSNGSLDKYGFQNLFLSIFLAGLYFHFRGKLLLIYFVYQIGVTDLTFNFVKVYIQVVTNLILIDTLFLL